MIAFRTWRILISNGRMPNQFGVAMRGPLGATNLRQLQWLPQRLLPMIARVDSRIGRWAGLLAKKSIAVPRMALVATHMIAKKASPLGTLHGRSRRRLGVATKRD